MWIRGLGVRHWRGLDFELTGLSPGMNLIFGPNESGKSRLVEALRFALFESSSGRSAHKKALATWGMGTEKPQVSVELELHGVNWHLEKLFLGSGHNTVLRSETERLEGADAEARLADLLGVGTGGRVELKPEDRGIWSLLWVDQGGSRDAPAHNEVSQTRIHDRLTAEIGEAAAGELGQRILRRAEDQRNRFFTTTRDAEKSILTEPREKVEHLARRLEEAVARRDAVAADADELDRQRVAEHDLGVRVAKAEQHLGDVRGRHELAVDLGRRLEVYDEQVRTWESKRDRRRELLDAAAELSAQIEKLGGRAQEAVVARSTAEAAREAAQQTFDRTSLAAEEADQRHAEQEAAVWKLRRQRELSGVREQTEHLRRRLAEAAGIRERADTLQQTLARLPAIAAGDVDRLRQAQDRCEAARARLEGASASVEVEAHQPVRIAGRSLEQGATHRFLVEDEQRLEVEGLITVTVRPGGGELPRLRDAAHDAERARAGLLEALGVEHLGKAAELAEQRRDHQAELDRCRQDLERLLPEGREAAEVRLRELEARLTTGPAGDHPVTAEQLEQAETALRELGRHRDELRAKRDVAAEALAAARETAASRRADVESLQRQVEDAFGRRDALPEADALQAALAEAEQAWRERLVTRDAMEERFDALGGEDMQLDLDQATKACEQLADELQQVRLRRAGLQARLESAGDDGRHEQVQELSAELLRAQTELAAVKRQAAAARRLHQVLTEEYESARERLAQPVIARIRPYLAGLFPNTEVWLDEDLNLLGLRAREADQAFDALSGGAREQLSLLVRIGLAEVLGTQESWPLVLDDVLVNTDAERIRVVQRLLYQASRHMQILLFTCHGPLFDTLGADARVELPQPQAANRSRYCEYTTGSTSADGMSPP